MKIMQKKIEGAKTFELQKLIKKLQAIQRGYSFRVDTLVYRRNDIINTRAAMRTKHNKDYLQDEIERDTLEIGCLTFKMAKYSFLEMYANHLLRTYK